ncbi:MAG: CvpA family protein [Chloroflexi bacterium]|nr:CvpA family protein [Chloroflexota bacterium]
MNWIDLGIIIIIAASAFYSLRTGFLRQAFAVIGLVVGIYGALTHRDALASELAPHISHAGMADMVAFLLILLAVWVAASFLASLAHGALKALGLAWADHLFGLLVGVLVGLFVVTSILLLFVRLPLSGLHNALQQSALAALIFRELPHLQQLLPRGLDLLKSI